MTKHTLHGSHESGLFGRVGRGAKTLFGGRADPRITPEQNEAASSDAFINAGLATLLAQGPGGLSPTLLQAISQGALTGREAGAASREASRGENRLAELRTAIDSGGFDTRDLFLRALSIGDLESAKELGDLAQTEATAGSRAASNIRVIDASGSEGPGKYQLLADGSLGRKIADLVPRGSAGQRFGVPRAFRSSEDGKRFMGVFDAEANDGAGGVIPVPGVIPDSTAGERTQEGLGNVGLVAQQALGPLNSELATLTTDFAASDNFFFSTAAFAAATPRQRIAMSLADTFLNVTVRWLSGAQMTDQERTNYRRAMIPRAFEDEFSIRVKVIMQENIARAMAAGVWQGEPTVDSDGNEIGDVDNLVAWTTQAQVEAIQQVLAEMEANGESGGAAAALRAL